MIRTCSKLARARRGSVITEFSISMLLVLMVLITTLEFGVEVFARQSIERAGGAAAEAYALTRSPDAARDAAMEEIISPMDTCIQPLTITIHNNMSSLKNGSGREAKGNSADNGARIAKLVLECEWKRLTPLPRLMLGPRMHHTVTTFVRVR